MGVMMANMDNPAPIAPAGPERGLLGHQLGVHIGLHGQPPRSPPTQGIGHPPSQVQPRPMGEGDHLDLAHANAGQLQTKPDRLVRKPPGMALPVEPLLLRQPHQPPIRQQTRRRVMTKTIHPQHKHPNHPHQ
jgi:hypothetical protein